MVASSDHSGREASPAQDPSREWITVQVSGPPEKVAEFLRAVSAPDTRRGVSLESMDTPSMVAAGETWAQAVGAWIADLAADHAASHVSRAKANVTKAAKFAGWTDVPSIDATGARRYLADLIGHGLSADTHNKRLSYLMVFGDWLVATERRGDNPFHAIRPARVRQRGAGVRGLSMADVDALVAAVPANRAAVYLVAAHTGLRWGELRRLRWGGVCLNTEPPRVEVLGKNGKVQPIPLTKRAMAALVSMRPHGVDPLDRVFATMPIGRTFNEDLALAGIPKKDERGRSAGPHSLRKAFISALAAAGVKPAELMRLARHSDANLTLKTYTDEALLNLAGAMGCIDGPIPTVKESEFSHEKSIADAGNGRYAPTVEASTMSDPTTHPDDRGAGRSHALAEPQQLASRERPVPGRGNPQDGGNARPARRGDYESHALPAELSRPGVSRVGRGNEGGDRGNRIAAVLRSLADLMEDGGAP